MFVTRWPIHPESAGHGFVQTHVATVVYLHLDAVVGRPRDGLDRDAVRIISAALPRRVMFGKIGVENVEARSLVGQLGES